MKEVVILASFDDLKSRHVRFLQEASALGRVHVLLLSDRAVEGLEGRALKYPQRERQYVVEAIRYVDRLTLVDEPPEHDALPAECQAAAPVWVVEESQASPARRAFCREHGWEFRVMPDSALRGFPEHPSPDSATDSARATKVIVTGCFDWFHSGHVRFFEEVSELGELYVVVGNDDNIRFLKGEGHPMFSADERRYMVGSIRHVRQSLIASGQGWLDAVHEIERIKPDIYAVNEDGDQPEKREYCRTHGIEYRVLKRLPREGLPKRQSTHLRGF